jgi:hypothetical protein
VSLAALEQLVDVARAKGDESANRFNVVLRQTRPMLLSPAFQQLLLKLVGDKEEVAVAREIQKAMKNVNSAASAPMATGARPGPYPVQRSKACFKCGKWGHFARFCWENRGGRYNK